MCECGAILELRVCPCPVVVEALAAAADVEAAGVADPAAAEETVVAFIS